MGFDVTFSDQEVNTWPQVTRQFISWYCYKDKASGRHALSGDNTRFMNHSATPNTGAAPGGPGNETVALHAIAAGEELTCDYFAFDANAAAKLGA